MPSWNWLSAPTQSPRIMWLSCLTWMTVMPLILPTVISKPIGDFWKSRSVLVSPVSLPIALKINPTPTTNYCMALWAPWSGSIFPTGPGYPWTLHPSFTESFHSFMPGLPNGAEEMKCCRLVPRHTHASQHFQSAPGSVLVTQQWLARTKALPSWNFSSSGAHTQTPGLQSQLGEWLLL